MFGSPITLSVVVFVFALLVTGSLVAGLAAVIRQQDRQIFEGAVSQSLDAIRERLAVTSTLVRGTAGLFHASDKVSGDEFRQYVASLDLRRQYPGILGIGFTRKLDPDEVRGFEQDVRDTGRPGFRVWPHGPRAEYHSIVYLEPLDQRNAAAVGYDMATDPVRRAAMTAAHERGQLVASGKVRLKQEIDPARQAGFLMYLAVYTRPVGKRPGDLLGYVYAPLRVDDLLAGTRGRAPKLVSYELFDGPRPDPQSLLRGNPQHQDSARLRADHTMEVAGRTWLIRFSSTPALDARSLQWLVPWLALAALVASALLARLSWLQGRARQVAESAVALQHEAAQALHRERTWLEATLGSIGDAVIAVDAGERITWMNPVAERLTGRPKHEALGHPIDAVVHVTAIDDDGSQAARLGQPGRGQAMLHSQQGTSRPVDHISAAIRDHQGHASGSVIVFRDASERHRVENELRESGRRKDEFLAMLAHELRNPLAPIRNAATWLGMHSNGNAQVDAASAIIARQVQHMVELVDDLLDVSRVTRGLVRIESETFDLHASARAAIEQVDGLIGSAGHTLDLQLEDGPLWVHGDRARLTQVIANLLNNAAKYTPAHGCISMRMDRVQGCIRIEVQDNGVGISRELLPHVFELFTQGERWLDRSQGGLGIGLALVSSIVKLHDGTLHAKSDGPGTGSTFTVMLPAASAPAQQACPPAPVAAVKAREPLRVAIVDDNADALRTTAMLLDAQGYQVDTFADAELTLQSIGEAPAEVYILDIGLPGISGHELARRLRAHPLTAESRLLALSGYGQAADVAASSAAGIDEHLVKPVSPERLLEALQKVERRA